MRNREEMVEDVQKRGAGLQIIEVYRAIQKMLQSMYLAGGAYGTRFNYQANEMLYS